LLHFFQNLKLSHRFLKKETGKRVARFVIHGHETLVATTREICASGSFWRQPAVLLQPGANLTIKTLCTTGSGSVAGRNAGLRLTLTAISAAGWNVADGSQSRAM
jgi:hypothetical protein